ncbi:hypothetical protein BCR42DRAFT_410725 [Absidia repens]|uniref:MARVEL domain-containing protein n=1 Tax=Absidia repens TaxID=90262 RepID=A0A1X2IPE0_9FUNG|nr:hypothetical protein BCR42DRAFT_410725 [Absidia repens]
MLRTSLFLNALIALFSCAGLCIDLTAAFQTQNSQLNGLYWQHWIYFGTFVLSILVNVVVSVHILYYGLLRRTRIICLIPLMLFFITLTSCIIFDDKAPLIDIKTDPQSAIMGGLFFHCALYNPDHDIDYPALYHRCMLLDATWLSAVIICLLWLVLFFIIWFASSSYFRTSPTQSSMQIYKYQISDSHLKLGPPSMTSRASSVDKRVGVNITNTNNKTMTDLSGPLKHLAYLPTKSLPPLNQRPSEDTLYLPIHSNATTAITSCYDSDSLLRGSLLQPHEEKVQVSDIWLQHFGPSLTFTTPSETCSKNHTYAHSMNLDWMKRINQQHGDTDDTGANSTNGNDDDDDDGAARVDEKKDDERIQQRDGGFIYPSSRRLIIAQSCPEFDNKNMKTLLKSTSNAADDTSLRY